jgi:iron transport multicopper oxidase
MGNFSYIGQKVPTLYTALTTGKDAWNPAVYGEWVNPFIFKYNEVIQVIINNNDTGFHPMHIHLHRMQLLWRGATFWDGNTSNFPVSPMRRDTIEVPPGGSIVLRFRADNPGIALCSFPPLSRFNTNANRYDSPLPH